MACKWCQDNATVLMMIWLCIVIIKTVLTLRALFAVQKLKHTQLFPVETVWLEKVKTFAAALGMAAKTCLHYSALIDQPIVIGWLKLILLPIGFFNGLTTAEAESKFTSRIGSYQKKGLPGEYRAGGYGKSFLL